MKEVRSRHSICYLNDRGELHGISASYFGVYGFCDKRIVMCRYNYVNGKIYGLFCMYNTIGKPIKINYHL